jgi:N-acetylglutamate synthase
MTRSEEYRSAGGMLFSIRAMEPEDYDRVIQLWKASEGIGLSKADSREAITLYLSRNPGLSQTAWTMQPDPQTQQVSPSLAGAVLCGHDGRRGLLHHLAVDPTWRRQGLGRELVERCLQSLRANGIDKCHLFVFNENKAGQQFWKSCGWYDRPELVLMSVDVPL